MKSGAVDSVRPRSARSRGAGALVSGHYTFSKNMTNAETLTTWLESGAGTPAAGYQTNNLEQERALSSFDVRPRMVRPASDQYFRARLGTGKAERSGNRGTLRISTD